MMQDIDREIDSNNTDSVLGSQMSELSSLDFGITGFTPGTKQEIKAEK